MTTVEASAYLDLTPAIVRYRVAGYRGGVGGLAVPMNRVMAKVSRTETATKFLSPAPEKVVRDLLAAGLITDTQAALAARLPMADDLTAEADSGGHTDNRPAMTLLPSLLAVREPAPGQVPVRHPAPGRAGRRHGHPGGRGRGVRHGGGVCRHG